MASVLVSLTQVSSDWLSHLLKKILRPLQKENGTLSDHAIIAAAYSLPRQNKVTKKTFSFRPITDKGIKVFEKLVISQDWSAIEKENATASADALNSLLRDFVEQSFPLRNRTIKSSDAPWVDRKVRRLSNRKRRIYRAEGKSRKYYDVSRECEAAIKDAKVLYLDKVEVKVQTAKNSKEFYIAVKLLNTKDAPVRWCISSMYPDKTDLEIAEIIAAFFNKISQEYTSLADPKCFNTGTSTIMPYQVAARLRTFRKPKSKVNGDIDPQLVNKYSDFLAIPLAYIYNQVLNTNEWPDLWKFETVNVIPKNNSPTGPSELRNLSCTPLFSKVLESFVLEQLRKEVKLNDGQYGGLKGCSAEHFLIESWDKIMSNLEDGDTAANLISVDFVHNRRNKFEFEFEFS